jgi:diaminohydroxyphosphoribosylaminopyrimidine deaminase/5-amino-6-(5-phosphoribosylamino)uracil reductase
MNTDHQKYMQRCIELAQKGLGNVAPNPMVGAVIVHNNKIIGEGYHQKYGEAHAEVNAIRSVKDTSLLAESTIYVSLEPCAHFGKTPPCSDLIIEKNIPHIVVGCIDPFSEVAGKGIEKLRNAGRNVEVGILEKECVELNKRFFTFHQQQRPYIILKWAQTKDGFIDKVRKDNLPQVNWITQPQTQQVTHLWRSQESAILVGKNTVINDNPSLTCRAIEGKNPIRIIIDKVLSLDSSVYSVFDNQAPTLILNTLKNEKIGNLEYVKLDFNHFFKAFNAELYNRGIQSVIIEGGAQTLQGFIDALNWDEARVWKSNQLFEVGIKAPTLSQSSLEQLTFGQDQLEIYYA